MHLTGWYQLENKSGTDFNAKVIIVENSAKLVEPKRSNTPRSTNPVSLSFTPPLLLHPNGIYLSFLFREYK
jgi:hypothetical protein